MSSMQERKRWQFPAWIFWTSLLMGFWAHLIICNAEGTDDTTSDSEGNTTEKRNYTLTGIPQIDYIHDPNLPRELNGYNLSSYPFFNRIPKNINFSCNGLKDGFYASVKHGCQLYHHCLFGTRYDFLCANYTAFDQRTFICQFVSDVDCPNSPLFFHRNDALYKAVETTTQAPVVIYVGPNGRRIRPAPLQPVREEAYNEKTEEIEPSGDRNKEDKIRDRDRGFPRRRNNRRRCGPGRRRRCRRPRPRPDYYDYYDYDDDYYESDRKKPKQKDREYDYEDYESEISDDKRKNKLKQEESNEFESRLGTSTRSPVSKAKAVPMSPPPPENDRPLDPTAVVAKRERIFSMSRAPPKIRPPVPIHEKSKFNAIQGRVEQETKPPKTTSTTVPPPQQVEYEDYYEDELDQPPSTTGHENRYLPTVPTTTTKRTTTTIPTSPPPSPDPQQYDYEYEDYEDPTTTTSTTSTTLRSTVRRSFGPRRNQMEETSRVAPVPGLEHQKINEALEAPSKASLRIPYHNKPRPSFLKNSQMLLPVTTLRSTTSTAAATLSTSTTSERTPPFLTTFDGINRRFPIFDTDTRLPLEAVSAAERMKQRGSRQRQGVKVTTTPETIQQEDYVGFQQEPDPEEGNERYGGNQYNNNPYLSMSKQQEYHQEQPQLYTRVAQRVEPTPSIPTFQPYFQQRGRIPVETTRSTTSIIPQQQQFPQQRPEYISLLTEDEDQGQPQQSPYLQKPTPQIQQRQSHQSRFLNTNRQLQSAAQEFYPFVSTQQYSPPPHIFNSRSLRRPNVFQNFHPEPIPFHYSYNG